MTRVVDFQAQSDQDGVERRERAERIKAEKEAAEKAAGTWVEPDEEAKLVVDPDDPDIQVAVTATDDEEEEDEEEAEDEDDEEEDETPSRASTPQALGYDDLVGKQGGMTSR